MEAQVLAFNGFIVDVRHRLLYGPGGENLALPSRAFDTLLFMAQHPQELLDKQRLMKAVWPQAIVEENNLSQHISLLRKVLGEEPGQHRFIITVPGRGFRFAPEVQPLDALPWTVPAPVVEPSPAVVDGNIVTPSPPPSDHAPRKLRHLSVAIGLAAATLVVAIGFHYFSRGIHPPAKTPSLAVLPFSSLSPVRDEEAFAAGLTEDVLNRLSQVPGLTVIGRSSSFSYKGKQQDPRNIANALGVAYLLQGSFRRDGKALRISTQLINGNDGAQVWSHTYDRPHEDILSVQDEVARDVARQLSIKLDVGDLPRREGGTTSPDAYEKFLKARELSLQDQSPQSLDEQLQLAREAVALDGDFSLGWWLLDRLLAFKSRVASAEQRTAIQRERSDASARMTALTPEAWWVKYAQAGRLMADRRWSEADTLTLAMMTDSLHTAANFEKGGARSSLLAITGRVREQVSYSRDGLVINPRLLIVSSNLQTGLYGLGQFDDVVREYERSRSMAGDHQPTDFLRLMIMVIRQSSPAEFNAQVDRVLQGQGPYSAITRELVRAGTNRSAAIAAIRTALHSPEYQTLEAMRSLALAADAYGDRDLAIEALRRMSLDLGGYGYFWFLPHSGVRSTPAFKQLLREVGLAEFFGRSGIWGDFCEQRANDFECR